MKEKYPLNMFALYIFMNILITNFVIGFLRKYVKSAITQTQPTKSIYMLHIRGNMALCVSMC